MGILLSMAKVVPESSYAKLSTLLKEHDTSSANVSSDTDVRHSAKRFQVSLASGPQNVMLSNASIDGNDFLVNTYEMALNENTHAVVKSLPPPAC